MFFLEQLIIEPESLFAFEEVRVITSKTVNNIEAVRANAPIIYSDKL